MRLIADEVRIPFKLFEREALHVLGKEVHGICADSEPLRLGIAASSSEECLVELGFVDGLDGAKMHLDSIFEFVRRRPLMSGPDCCVLVVPTGVGAEIGGHAGDAGPVSRLLGQCCDVLVTHANVVNASDINELPENGMYLEGSSLTRLLMGTIGLRQSKANNLLVILDGEGEPMFINAAVNAVNAARATYGLKCRDIVVLDQPLEMRPKYASTGTAVGDVDGLLAVCNVFDKFEGTYDAVALSSIIKVPESYHLDYFRSGGEMINPWGGVEAMMTHCLSLLYNVPVAHAPMFESLAVSSLDPGIVDPRMAAEAVSVTFLQCLLKGLMRSPEIVIGSEVSGAGIITASNVSCMVQPDGCIGLATLAALEQGIVVIAVRESTTRMQNEVSLLPWADGQFYRVENYWEAAGVIQLLRSGMDPWSVRRPLKASLVHDLRTTLSVRRSVPEL